MSFLRRINLKTNRKRPIENINEPNSHTQITRKNLDYFHRYNYR